MNEKKGHSRRKDLREKEGGDGAVKKFSYVAVDRRQKKISGSYLAESEDDLRRQLVQQGLYLVRCRAAPETSPKASFFSLSSRVKLSELTTFCRQFAIMVNVGISVLDSLKLLQRQRFSGLFKKVLYVMAEDVQSGLLLSQAMKKHRKVFPEFFCSMVSVGERGSSLDAVLVHVADYYERAAALRKKVKSAASYPAILLALTVGLVVLMAMFVIPRFQAAFAAMDMEMPALTMAIFRFSAYLKENWRLLFLCVCGVIACLCLVGRTRKGRYFYHTLAVKAPALGRYSAYSVSSRFARSFGMLLAGGMDAINALEIIANTLGNQYVERRFREAVNEVKKGTGLTMAFASCRLFPQLLLQMMSIGEKTGAMDEVLLGSCQHLDELTEGALQALTGFIQPVLLAILGGTVGLLFLAVYSPIITIMQNYL